MIGAFCACPQNGCLVVRYFPRHVMAGRSFGRPIDDITEGMRTLTNELARVQKTRLPVHEIPPNNGGRH